MIIGKKYYFMVYISEILFFQTTLFLFGKFTKRLYSTSLTEKYFDCRILTNLQSTWYIKFKKVSQKISFASTFFYV